MNREEQQGATPPHSIEAEQQILGAILIENEAYDVCAELVAEADFYADGHRKIWRAIAQQIAVGKPADAVTVVARLDAAGALESVGGIEYVGSLQMSVLTARNIEAYAKIVRERSQLRKIAAAASQLHALAVNPLGKTAAELLAEVGQVLDGLEDDGATEEVQPIGAYLAALVDRIEDRSKRGEIQGLATGLRDLDRITAGLQRGDLVLVAGRPSMGKSALAMQIAQDTALSGKSVVVFSLEMGRDQLLERMVSNVGMVNSDALRTGRLNTDEWAGVSAAFGRLQDIRLICHDAGDLSISRVRSLARKAKRKGGCDLVVVDYLQLLAPESGAENRNAEITAISRGLKLMARELDCPVIALSQLSRKVEERTNKRPVPSDLRDSGALEQDADVIALIYRDEVYHDEETNPMRGIAEIIIAKQRMGRTGTVFAEFAGEYSRFRDTSHGWRKPEPPAPRKAGKAIAA